MKQRTSEDVLKRLDAIDPSEAPSPRMALLARIECLRSIAEGPIHRDYAARLHKTCEALYDLERMQNYDGDMLPARRADLMIKRYRGNVCQLNS